MFKLDGSVKYWLYNKPVDMRKSFNGLSGIVTNGMCASLRSGDVYIFMNASRNMMKMLRQEEGGLVLYAIRLDIGRMKPAVQASDDELISSGISWTLNPHAQDHTGTVSYVNNGQFVVIFTDNSYGQLS